MTKNRFWAAGWVALIVASAGAAFAASPAAVASPADARLETQKAAFLAMPEADRKAVQDALGWLDFYNGAVDGAFGKRTRDSVVAYQQSVGASADGMVSPAQLAALKTAAQRARAAVDFALIDDRISGVRIGAPLKLLTRLKPSSGDTVLQSGDGSVSLTLQDRAGTGEDAGLAALYAERSTEAGGRKVTYKALKAGEFFVVAGEDKGAKFYIRYARSPADWSDGPSLRGFAFAYPAERSGDFDKLALAVANAFEPFADTPASHGAAALRAAPARSSLDVVRVATGAPALADPVIGLSPGSRPTPTPAPASPTPIPAASAELRATALFVAPGQALTALPVVACAELVVAGKPAKILRADAPSGLTLIGGDFGPSAEAPRLAMGATDLVALSLSPAAAGKSTLEASPAAFAPIGGGGGGAIVAALDKSASGAPAFDRQGALAGLVASIKDAPRRVGAVAIAEPHKLIAADVVGAFLGVAPAVAAGPAATFTAGEIAARERGALADVICRP